MIYQTVGESSHDNLQHVSPNHQIQWGIRCNMIPCILDHGYFPCPLGYVGLNLPQLQLANHRVKPKSPLGGGRTQQPSLHDRRFRTICGGSCWLPARGRSGFEPRPDPRPRAEPGTIPTSQSAWSNYRTGGGDLGHQVVVPFTLDLNVGRSAQ